MSGLHQQLSDSDTVERRSNDITFCAWCGYYYLTDVFDDYASSLADLEPHYAVLWYDRIVERVVHSYVGFGQIGTKAAASRLDLATQATLFEGCSLWGAICSAVAAEVASSPLRSRFVGVRSPSGEIV